eukprot:CAMPEP_0196828166 /NCGR_PEP_ID=MMETSP1362-20130617/94540_1 /TAXON_ID=163516 /ORGANISM="Leptocylindrus danicus, Strain CCMP1856" /LENGTH=371 /DNA_ID=CAMNT_0042208835 /DNA_START=92 /DNA_END=1204 /DNA_ORIENTATION=-
MLTFFKQRGTSAAFSLMSSSAAATTTEQLKFVNGLEDVLKNESDNNARPTTFLLDMWGVMHNGSKPYEGVIETIQKLKNENNGVRMVILSNSSKRQSHSITMLKKLGFNPDDFDDIITSGEVSHRMLSGDDALNCDTWECLTNLMKNDGNNDRKKVFVYGSGSNDEEYCMSAGWELASVEEANLILARGTFTINDGCGDVVDKNEDAEQYDQMLAETLAIAAKRRIPMLVSNPDKVRPDEGLPPMPGAIADQYEAALGGGQTATDLVKRIGKPFKEVYDLALYSSQDEASSACMVGDALETDVTGGNSIGCTTVWVINDGIHGPDVLEKGEGNYEDGVAEVLSCFNEARVKAKGDDSAKVMPTFVIPHFRW